uniref:Glutamate-ammonia ligase n=1 Tax=Solanum tuberosum TaxID=4113 RepID=M1AKN4_SOLTU
MCPDVQHFHCLILYGDKYMDLNVIYVTIVRFFYQVSGDGKETWARIDKTSYCSTTAIDDASLVLQEIVASLHSFNILVEQVKAGKGQFEIVLGYTDCGRAANNLIITHEVVKGVARKHGLLASFTPRYYNNNVCPQSYAHSTDDDVGSGSHVHISLFKNGENIFMASGEPNSYERLIPKARNSSFICWGIECKELPVRACCPPGVPNGVVTNFEMKTFDGSANPHLGLASIIIAGIDGMRRKLPIPGPVEPESYDFDWNNDDIKLPWSLRCAIIHMDSDKWFNEMLGKEFICTRGGVVGEEIGHDFCGGDEKYKHIMFNY